MVIKYTPPISRAESVKVKTARGRKISSTRWLQRQLNDPFVQAAKAKGYRARSAFKLIEIQEKFNIFKNNQTIIDLGCAPGGWLQVAKELSKNSTIIGVDLLKTEPIDGVIFIQGNFLDKTLQEEIENTVKNKKFDVILSDMSPSTSGHKSSDHLRIVALCEEVFDFSKKHLKEGGFLIMKVFQGGASNDILKEIKQKFKTTKHFKPQASRKQSPELYLIAKSFMI